MVSGKLYSLYNVAYGLIEKTVQFPSPIIILYLGKQTVINVVYSQVPANRMLDM